MLPLSTGVGADPAPEVIVQVLAPAQGLPMNATPTEAATGGQAAGIASVAATVASGGSESSAVRSLNEVRLSFASCAERAQTKVHPSAYIVTYPDEQLCWAARKWQ